MKRFLTIISFWLLALGIFAAGRGEFVRDSEPETGCERAVLAELPAGGSDDYAIEANSLFVSPVQTAEYCSRSSQSEIPNGRFHHQSFRRPAESDAPQRVLPVRRRTADCISKDAVVRYVYMLHRLRI